MCDWWTWLDDNSKAIGAVSSIVFGLSSAVVAWVALTVSYRNGFGWKPMVLLKEQRTGGGANWREVSCTFQVWNLRKYPISIREKIVSFGDVRVNYEAPDMDGEKTIWYVTDTGLLMSSEGVTVEPTSHQSFEPQGPIPIDCDVLLGPVEVWVKIFDPRKNKQVILRSNLGSRWKRWRQRSQVPYYRASKGPVRRRGRGVGA